MGKRILDFFVYSNIFIAGCAVLMVDQTYRLILFTPPNTDLLWFVFFSTICSYSFHWWLPSHSVIRSPRLDWEKKFRWVHVVLFLLALPGAIYFFIQLLPWWYGMAILAVMTFLYSAPKIPHPLFRTLRKVALGKTIFLAGVWMGVTTLLPILVSDQEWFTIDTLFILHRFFLIYAICILFDYRDRQDDKAAGLRSLVTYLDEKGIFYLFVFSLSVFTVSTLLMKPYLYYAPWTILILLLPGVFVALLYNYARKHFSDRLYYFVLDGLMALSPVLFLVFDL